MLDLPVLEREEEREEEGEELINVEYHWDFYTEEILPRVPAKYLLILKCVSKNWYRIISSPSFTRLHLKMCNERRIRILVANPWKRWNWGMIEYNGDDGETKQIRPPPSLPRRPLLILGSCDGLLCLLLHGRRSIALYNPSTGECFIVKVSRRQRDFCRVCCSWFGYSLLYNMREYVLVLVTFLGSENEIQVYKFTRTSELEPIHYLIVGMTFPCSAFAERGTFLHGVVHWPAMRHGGRHVICAYHPGDNKYSEILPPVQSHFNIGVVHGCLCAVFVPTNDQFDSELWVMKQYGVEQSWTKYANLQGFNARLLSPLGFFPNGDLILDVNGSRLVRYNFNHSKPVLLVNYESIHRAIICADSLVSPKIFEGRGRLE